MKKTVPFKLFGPNQYLMFDIIRTRDFENSLGKSLTKIIAESEVTIDFCIYGLMYGLKQHYHKATPAFFAEKMEEYFDNGGNLSGIATPIIQAIMKSGIFGKIDEDEAEEKAEETEKNV